MKNFNKSFLFAASLLSVSLILPACSQSDNQVDSSAGAQGTLGLGIDFRGLSGVVKVGYTVTGPNGYFLEGEAPVSEPERLSLRIGQIPAGTGYNVKLVAYGKDGKLCEGSSDFEVIANKVTDYFVPMNCGTGTPDNLGGVEVNGKVEGSACAYIENIVVVPRVADLGTDIALLGNAVPGLPSDVLKYSWKKDGQEIAATKDASYKCDTAGTYDFSFSVNDNRCDEKSYDFKVICKAAGAVCGNGTVDEGEECDDGNSDNGDGCDSTCTKEPVCGNGSIEGSEQCDDGNTANGDGCSSECKTEAFCGDGNVDTGEECDDGNTANGDGCSSECKTEAFCGDGNVDTGEECDDGNTANGDGCSSECKTEAFCGDGNVDTGEECDDGNTASGDGCSSDCKKEASCGNGTIDAGEECDDGNTVDGDGCSSACKNEVDGVWFDDPKFPAGCLSCMERLCTDDEFGIDITKTVCPKNDAGCREQLGCGLENGCVNGTLGAVGCYCGTTEFSKCQNSSDSEEPNGPCKAQYEASFGTSKSEEVIERYLNQAYDAGRANLSYACMSQYCLKECVQSLVVCGNGKTESGEECDDGNKVDGDGCSADCKIEVDPCGNGTVDSGEECDDGNKVDGDGCSAECKKENLGVGTWFDSPKFPAGCLGCMESFCTEDEFGIDVTKVVCPADDDDCREQLSCGIDNGCVNGTLGAVGCYCGTTEFSKCQNSSDSEEPNGPCKEQYEKNFGTSKSEEVIERYLNQDWAAGRANLSYACMSQYCLKQCLNG